MHPVDRYQEGLFSPVQFTGAAHSAYSPVPQKPAEKKRKKICKVLGLLALQKVFDSIRVRQTACLAIGKTKHVVHKAFRSLVKVMLPVGPVSDGAPDDGRNHKLRHTERGASLDTEVLEAGQFPQEIRKDDFQDMEEVGVVDSRLFLLRLAARAVGTCSRMSCSASALISFSTFCIRLYSRTHFLTSSA